MTRQLMLVISLVSVSLGVAANAAAQNGPYYATPTWDQSITCAVGTCPRFIVLSNFGDQAVLDRETGLVWEQNPSSFPVTWTDALHGVFGCTFKTTGGHMGWRAPTIEELQTLTNGTFASLPPGHPFGAGATGNFWSATTYSGDSTDAELWAIGATGSEAGSFAKSQTNPVWCVRSPSPGFVGQ